MGRPANTSAVETRARILDSAFNLFAERGAASTSIRDVAGAAKVTSAMVGHYFGNKEMLYDACVVETFRELRQMSAHLEIVLMEDIEVPELLDKAVRTVFQFACSRRTAVRLLVRAAMSTGELHPYGFDLLMGTMKVVTDFMARRLHRKAEDLRLPLQSLVFLVARYATQAERELALVVGSRAKNKADALTKVEDHLVLVALELFGVSVDHVDSKTKRGAR
jgi:TetR/AcrR family transcriptional regulator, regulator of cefoperazone and chloramphenicol sensitivity